MTARRTLFILSLLILFAAGARAQTPAGPPRIDLATVEGSAFLDSIAVDGLGNVTLVWGEYPGRRTFVRRFSGTDAPLGAFQLSRFSTSPRAAANERGDTVVIWNQSSQNGGEEVRVRRLNPALPPLTIRADRGRAALLRVAGDVDVDRQGRFVAVWSESDGNGGSTRVRRFNADGTYRGTELVLPVGLGPRVAMNPATGDFLVVWTSPGFVRPARIFVQRFSFDTGFLGRAFQVNTTPVGEFATPDVGCAEDGSCVVFWHRFAGRDRPGDVFFQRFGPDGKRRGGETHAGRSAPLGYPVSLAVAPEGHFVVAWTAASGSPIHFRLFRRDGTPAGPEMEITETEIPASPHLAFGWDGTFVLGWTDFAGHLGDFTWEINYQRFEVPPGLQAEGAIP